MRRLARIATGVAATAVALAGTIAAVASTPPSAPGGQVTAAMPTVTVDPVDPVATPSPADAPLRIDRCARTTHDVILVDISDQHLWTCHRGATVMTSAVTTGADVHPTPTGRWRVYAKEDHRWISGEDYSRLVDRWMPFHGGYGFHDSTWQRFPYGDDAWHQKGSHGCVHVPLRVMKQLYSWSHQGTRVHIVA